MKTNSPVRVVTYLKKVYIFGIKLVRNLSYLK